MRNPGRRSQRPVGAGATAGGHDRRRAGAVRLRGPAALPVAPTGPKCVWVSLHSDGLAAGWSKMRLSSAVSARSRRIRADSDAFWNTCPPCLRSHPRLRRILEHQTTRRTLRHHVGIHCHAADSAHRWTSRRRASHGVPEPMNAFTHAVGPWCLPATSGRLTLLSFRSWTPMTDRPHSRATPREKRRGNRANGLRADLMEKRIASLTEQRHRGKANWSRRRRAPLSLRFSRRSRS